MNKSISSWGELLFSSLKSLTDTVMAAIPSIVGALVMLLVGWLVAKSVAFIVVKILRNLNFDKLAERPPFQEYIERANIKTKPSEVVRKFIYWTLYLLFIVTAAETLGLEVVSSEISKLIAYLPQLFAALVIFVIGIYIITFIRDFIRAATASMGMSAGKFISGLVFYLMFTILVLTTLDQAGIDTSIITANLNIIMAAVLFSFALAYAFASREILSNILASFFSRKLFEIGQEIELDDLRGVIEEIGTTSVKIRTRDELLIVPTQHLLNNRVKIHSNK